MHRERKDYQPIVDTSKPLERGISRCIEFQNRESNRVTILAFSGGKDSLVAYLVAVESGIEFIPIYSPTSVDPPELIYYIRKIFNPWVKSKGYPEVIIQKYHKFNSRRCKGKKTDKDITMWSLIETRKMPPTRMVRYCCPELKERTGESGDTVITGVRWEESKNRREQQMVNFYNGKIIVRIIVDWTEIEVWSFILANKVPYCELYDKGFNRLGCIGCPLGSNQRKELNMYPKYKRLYIRAFEKMLKNGREDGKEYEWKTGEDVMKWWLGDCEKKRQEIDGQCSMF